MEVFLLAPTYVMLIANFLDLFMFNLKIEFIAYTQWYYNTMEHTNYSCEYMDIDIYSEYLSKSESDELFR